MDLSQLRTTAATDFRQISEDLLEAVRQAVADLEDLGHFPTAEETDRRFVEWCAPKKEECIGLLGQFGHAYGDVGQKLFTMQDNVAVADWASADDLTVKSIPVYAEPERDDLTPKGPLP